MKITINNKTIELKYTLRSYIIYEKITGKSFTSLGVTEVLVYFYSTILASYKDFNMSFEEFIEWLDNNPNILKEFSNWIYSIMERNSFIVEPEHSDENMTKKN